MTKRKRNEESDDEYSDEEEHNKSMESEIEWQEHEDGRSNDASSRYKKLDQIEHILLRPETYIGSIESEKKELWVWDKNSQMLVLKEIKYVPGLYKIFDEILVNAADNKIRDKDMNRIDVTIDAEKNEISIKNNGKGIPVEIHKEHNVYIPTMIFGMLLTGDNFDDNQKRVTGGRNGYGAKLCNIFSSEFIVETVDSTNGKKFKQVWRKNMSQAETPKIVSSKLKDYTMVTFKPDLSKFGLEKLDDDIVSLLTKRVYDIAGTSGVNVYLNGSKLKIKSFKEYVKLYALDKKLAFQVVNERWSVGVTLSDGTPQQVSFVNSICTTNGGKHVEHITSQIVKNLKDKLNKKNKGAPIKPQHIKNQLFIFVNALIINPTFDSQTKDTLTTNMTKFGSKCTIDEEFMKQINKIGIEEAVLKFAESKSGEALKRQSGKKKVRLTGISKLDDANDAGGKLSEKCTRILTEGDSAKALAVAGLGVIGRDKYGVFPLKGKPLNVRDCATSRVTNNDEIKALTQILGLQHQKSYTKEDLKKLRYGSIMIMADQDHDGSHIKGLIINWIHKFWPSLLEVNGFLKEFITPIIKAFNKRQNKELSFFSIAEYNSWKESLNNDTSGWVIKYYKGLGTSTAKEAKDYFNNMVKHQKIFKWEGEESQNKIITAFAKDKVDQRKKWLAEHKDSKEERDLSKKVVKYSEFFDKEFVQFSLADCARSIPSLVDGLKPGQRKILFSCFKRNLTKEIKVAQLSGYVAEHSAYHHGEASLASTIINMAQNFVGANNINLLVPSGQFGTRLQGGKDSASPRYIFTCLSKITRYIYNRNDDEILEYLDDDGQSIEPRYYAPIIPMVLVNGAEGIGTAWSTFIPNYNPIDVVENIKRLIKGEKTIDMTPWFKGFEGDTAMLDLNKWETRGKLEKIDETTIKITELPVRVWTQSYKEQLEDFIEQKLIEEFRENHTDLTVSFTVTMTKSQMAKAEEKGLLEFFKLSKKIGTTNMTLFSPEGVIKTYNSTHEILEEFFEVRKRFYNQRKEHLLRKLQREFDILSNKVRFILAVIDGDIVLKKRKKADILSELKKKNYTPFPKTKDKIKVAASNRDDENGASEESEDEEESNSEIKRLELGYNYLLSMPLWSLTFEKVKKLEKEKSAKQNEIEVLKATSIEDMWIKELDEFLTVLAEVESKEAEEEVEYLKKLAKKKGGKMDIHQRTANTSLYRPAPIIVPKKEKKTKAVKKSPAESKDKMRQTELDFKKKKEDSYSDGDEDIEMENKSTLKKETTATDEAEEEYKGSLLERMQQKKQSIETQKKDKKSDDSSKSSNKKSEVVVLTESNSNKAKKKEEELSPLQEKNTKSKTATSKPVTAKKKHEDSDFLLDEESPIKITGTKRASPLSSQNITASSVKTNKAGTKRRKVQTNTLDSYLKKEKKEVEVDEEEISVLKSLSDEEEEEEEKPKRKARGTTTKKATYISEDEDISLLKSSSDEEEEKPKRKARATATKKATYVSEDEDSDFAELEEETDEDYDPED